ncbi:hypothetical protein L210DRAFT_3352771, partial [Boletus edulis BED1]
HSMISRQELSAQQVCSYLLAHGDHYTSHVYRNMYWSSFEHHDGNVIACTNQVDDYRFRSQALQNVCLWDFCAQVDKVQRRHRGDDVEEHEADSDCLTEDDSDNREFMSGVQGLDVLSDTSYRRPCFQFLSNHVESKTRQLRVRHPSKRYVPVPIGSALPRQDREEFMARHARAMLLLFKPWRSASDLREGKDSWTSAYNAWTVDPRGTYPSKCRIVDNIHALQECKDAWDQH